MKITIRQPLGFSEIGQKENQEDSTYPLFDNVDNHQHCFLLCDGVGGNEKGEVASRTVCDVMGNYLDKKLTDTDKAFSIEEIQNAVDLAYDALEAIDHSNTQKRMGTTCTCLCLTTDGVVAAHMGDSRIYQIRPKQGLIYQSSDHSLVNVLLMAGELTPEEAKTFPRKNVITKAIQPYPEKRLKAEVHLLTDVQSGDYFFLCCDGVLEQLTNERLVKILSLDTDDKKKIDLIKGECMDKTHDNFTAYLIPIDKVKGISTVQDDEISNVTVDGVIEKRVDTERKGLLDNFTSKVRRLFAK